MTDQSAHLQICAAIKSYFDREDGLAGEEKDPGDELAASEQAEPESVSS